MPSDGPSAVLPAFEAYQAARLDMAQALAGLAVPPAHRPGAEGKVPSATEEAEYREALAALESYAPTLMRTVGPLCHDLVPGVQLSSVVALSHLARASDQLSAAIAARNGLLPHVLHLLASTGVGKDVRLGAAGLLLQILREPGACTQAVEAGALSQLVDHFEVRRGRRRAGETAAPGAHARSRVPPASARSTPRARPPRRSTSPRCRRSRSGASAPWPPSTTRARPP